MPSGFESNPVFFDRQELFCRSASGTIYRKPLTMHVIEHYKGVLIDIIRGSGLAFPSRNSYTDCFAQEAERF
jgi:hypothetical protein